jgi:hypothetical protein
MYQCRRTVSFEAKKMFSLRFASKRKKINLFQAKNWKRKEAKK